MRFFISYVGNNDPYGRPDDAGRQTFGPIMALLKHLNEIVQFPEKILLLTTTTHLKEYWINARRIEFEQAGLEDKAGVLKLEIEEHFKMPSDNIEILKLTFNPTDLDEVITETLTQLQGKLDDPDEVHVNISSGTQAMSSAITFLADSRYIPNVQVWQVFDPNKIPANFPRVKQVGLSFLSERDRLELPFNMLKAFSFSQAVQGFKELEDRSLIPARRPRAHAAAELAQVYDRWDRSHFSSALRQMNTAKKLLTQCQIWDEIPRLKDQLAALRNLQGIATEMKETKAVLLDLHASILRRYAARNYINTATRARRLYEAILNYWLLKAGINPRAITSNQIESIEDQGLKNKVDSYVNAQAKDHNWKTNRSPIHLKTLKSKLDIANALADYRYLGQITPDHVSTVEECYLNFDNIRNFSYEQHGLAATSKADAESVITNCEQMLATALTPELDNEDLNHLPFAADTVVEVADRLATLLSS